MNCKDTYSMLGRSSLAPSPDYSLSAKGWGTCERPLAGILGYTRGASLRRSPRLKDHRPWVLEASTVVPIARSGLTNLSSVY